MLKLVFHSSKPDTLSQRLCAQILLIVGKRAITIYKHTVQRTPNKIDAIDFNYAKGSKEIVP